MTLTKPDTTTETVEVAPLPGGLIITRRPRIAAPGQGRRKHEPQNRPNSGDPMTVLAHEQAVAVLTVVHPDASSITRVFIDDDH